MLKVAKIEIQPKMSEAVSGALRGTANLCWIQSQMYQVWLRWRLIPPLSWTARVHQFTVSCVNECLKDWMIKWEGLQTIVSSMFIVRCVCDFTLDVDDV